MEQRLDKDDFDVVKNMVPKWIEEKKVIFFQSYHPLDPDEMKKPFVLVIQTEEMLKRAIAMNLPNFAWVLDLTFKTNH